LRGFAAASSAAAGDDALTGERGMSDALGRQLNEGGEILELKRAERDNAPAVCPPNEPNKDKLELQKLAIEVAEAQARQSALPAKAQHERDKEGFELKKLAFEAAEAEARQSTLPEKGAHEKKRQLLELQKLQYDLRHQTRMDRLAERKAILEVREKRIATKFGIPTGTSDILKYAVTLIPVLITVATFYHSYRKDTEAQRHQIELEQKFKIDTQVINLIKNLTQDATDATQAAVLLPTYGRQAVRIIIPHLRITASDHVYKVLVGALVDVIAAEKDESARREGADEVVQRLADQTDLRVKELLPDPLNSAKRAPVTRHLDAFLQLRESCATACEALKIAVAKRAPRIGRTLKVLEDRRRDLEGNDGLLGSVQKLQTALSTGHTS
jgi:hypothetical protein